ncbi:unnamed protein product [Blepharisma stoltei]|uniref:Uncharacterized protein n=1 Tax=Blepharisma stoltei TaxID=1481888 RepID=A0AAU9KAZ0_9CILI|nr:unnamed protein product [Blepharisma stoltei]
MRAKKCFESGCMNEVEHENIKSLKGPENANNSIKKSLKSGARLLNSKISAVSNYLNSKPKGTESALKVIDILRNKTAEIMSRWNNSELEIDFRKTCSAIQANSNFYDPPVMQAYQDYLKAYQQKSSLYNITTDYKTERTNLQIYNTETEAQEVKILWTPQLLDKETCITQLPNGKLFCYGNNTLSGITVLIDVNGGIKVLPSGTKKSQLFFINFVYFAWIRNIFRSSRKL